MSKWDGIDEFLAVASMCSFTKGAQKLGLSATHVSRAVKALEDRLQSQLLYRTTRMVRLTDTGRIFQERFQRIAQETDEAIAFISERSDPQGQLRVTCSTAMGERFVAPIVRRFAARYPMLSVSIELSNHIVDLVAEGFDLAVRTGEILDSRLIGTRVATRKLLTCAAPSYLAQAGRPSTVADLIAHDCIVGTSPTWHFKAEDKSVEFRPSGRFQCNSGHAVIEACIAGMGICQLPEFYILPHIRNGLVELVLDDYCPDEQPIWAVYPQRRHLVPKVQLVVEDLQRELGSALSTPNSFSSSSAPRIDQL